MEPTYKGEAMLLRWGETSTAGRTVTFIIEEDTPENPFKGLPVGKDGQRFMVVAVPIGNDQKPVEMEKPKAKTPWREMKRSQQAGMLCADPSFQEFLLTTERADDTVVMDADEAGSVVRLICKVGSRRDFDIYDHPGKRWDALAAEYRQWAGLEPEQRT